MQYKITLTNCTDCIIIRLFNINSIKINSERFKNLKSIKKYNARKKEAGGRGKSSFW